MLRIPPHYNLLRIHEDTPSEVQMFIRSHLDFMFSDAYNMLRFPIPDRGLFGDGNWAAANHLLSLISGISRVLYFPRDEDTKTGPLFKHVLEQFYPWDKEPDGGVKGKDGAYFLYEVFRNPLSHVLGLGNERKFNGIRQCKIEKYSRAAKELKRLELEGHQLTIPTPTLVRNGKVITLSILSLYWGTRQLVLRLTGDPVSMKWAVKFLPK
jgi:hypothetical protein